MQVKVRKINSMGKPLFSGNPTRQTVYPGRLKVMENRIHALGRVVVTASIIDSIDANAATLIELYDAVLLWADEKRMRMRGFASRCCRGGAAAMNRSWRSPRTAGCSFAASLSLCPSFRV